MIELARLTEGAKINRPTPAVEAARASQKIGDDKSQESSQAQETAVSAVAVGPEVNQETPAASPSSKQDLEKVVADANANLQYANTSLHFQLDNDTDKVVVRVVSNETGEVIRQLPPEELLKMAAELSKITAEMKEKGTQGTRDIRGLVVDSKF